MTEFDQQTRNCAQSASCAQNGIDIVQKSANHDPHLRISLLLTPTGNQKMAFQRVAKEGPTSDGREIKREWIEQMAATYDPKTYGARVNLEHFRGILPDSPFRAYGDVLALKTEEDADKKLVLLADIKPTDDLIKMNQAKQKVYPSIEIDPNFAKTNQAYLTGIAVTDSPASLGTDYLKFTVGKRGGGERDYYSFISETPLEFAAEEPSLLEQLKALFATSNKKADPPTPVPPPAAPPATTAENPAMQQMFELTGKALTNLNEKLESLVTAQQSLRADLTALSQTPTDARTRPPATGGSSDNKYATDC